MCVFLRNTTSKQEFEKSRKSRKSSIRESSRLFVGSLGENERRHKQELIKENEKETECEREWKQDEK